MHKLILGAAAVIISGQALRLISPPPMVTEVEGAGKAMDNTSTRKNKVLVAGASGLLGIAATERFRSAGWDVIGVSRRKPELPSGRNVEFL